MEKTNKGKELSDDDIIRYLETDEIHFFLRNLPTTVRGILFHDANDYPIVILNARLTREMNCSTSFHEARHILTGEFDDPDFMEYTG